MNVNALQTTQDRLVVNQALDSINKNAYTSQVRSDSDLLAELSPLAVVVLQAPPLPKPEQVEAIKNQLELLPSVQVTLPFFPTERLQNEFSEWSRQHLHPNVLIDFQLDRQLLGGFQMSWRGVFFDGSLQRKITVAQKDAAQF